MNIEFETNAPKFHHDESFALLHIENMVGQLEEASGETCCLCQASPVRRASRFVKDGVRMPICTRTQHDDEAVEELLRPSYTLADAEELIRMFYSEGEAAE